MKTIILSVCLEVMRSFLFDSKEVRGVMVFPIVASEAQGHSGKFSANMMELGCFMCISEHDKLVFLVLEITRLLQSSWGSVYGSTHGII